MREGPPHGREDPALRDDDDAVWEDLVARIGPLEPPTDDEPAPGAETSGDPGDPGDPGAAGLDEAPSEDGPEQGYVPDDVEPLTDAGLAWWAPWIALVGAPVVLALVALTRSSVPGWLVLGCVTVFAGGAVLAVLRLPSADTGDPGDDGARL